jgi:hypothetical protein
MRARFRRIVGTFGAVSLIVGSAAGAALAIGEGTASAGVVSAFSVDLNAPTGINQNTIGNPGAPVTHVGLVNAGGGWSFTVTNWVAGETINILTGTPNGGPGIECNTTQPDGVNQTQVDLSNYVYFSAADTGGTTTTDSPIIETTGGTIAPIITTLVSQSPATAYDAVGFPGFANNGGCPSNTTGDGDLLTLTFQNTAVTGAAAQVFLGYANSVGNPASSVDEPVTFDTGFGAATGPVPFIATDSTTGTAIITVPSSATVIGETPSANVPSSALVRQTSVETVPSTAISNFSITETGESLGIDAPLVSGNLPPNSGTLAAGTASPPAMEPTDIGGTGTQPIGAVCLVIDNSTSQNLIFSTPPTGAPVWSVNPGASTAGFTATAGGAIIVNGGNELQLPVTSPSNAPTTWTASGLSLMTALGDRTDADGPVYAFAYFVFGDPTSATLCSGAALPNTGNSAAANPPTAPTDHVLGYVQLGTVSELANSIYGAAAVDTAAQAIGHQFNYANGQCLGNQFPQFFNGGPLFVASDADYHDALGAAYPAGADDSAVALTDPNSISQATLDIIRQEGVQTVYLVGGDLAISNNVQNQLAATPSYLCGGVNPRFAFGTGLPEDLTVIRIAGFTADDTNLQLATFPGAQPPTPWQPFGAFANPAAFNDTGTGASTAAPTSPVQNIAVVVSDAGFQDAVSASAIAYGWPLPLVVTNPTNLDSDALAALADGHVTEVILVGGVDAVSDNIVTELSGFGISVLRVAGMDASDTSTQLASFELAAAPVLALGLVPTGLAENNNDGLWQNFVNRTAGVIAGPNFDGVHAHAIMLARGDFYADAETASVLSIHNGFFASSTPFKPLLLTESPSVLGSAVTSFLNKAGLAVSALNGAFPAWGHDGSDGEQWNDSSSNVYTIQPIGGIFALNPSTLTAALAAVTAG